MKIYSSCKTGWLILILAAMLTACTAAKQPATDQAGEPFTIVADGSEAESLQEEGKDLVCEPENMQAANALEPVEEVVELNVAPAEDPAPLTTEEKEALETRLDLDIEMGEDDAKVVESYFKYFTHRGRRTFERYLERAQKYLPHAKRTFKEMGLPEEVVYLAFVESGFNPNAYSRAGAAGVWQFMPYTGRKYGLSIDWWMDERRDPYKAAVSAATYLNKLHGDFDDWYLAIAAYNAGEGKIGRAIKGTGADSFFELTQKNHKLSRRAQLRKETRHYVPKLLAVVKIMRNLEKLGFEPIDQDCAIDVSEVKIKGGTDLLALARNIGMDWKSFSAYNPAFRRYVSPPDRESSIYVPHEMVASVESFMASNAATPYAGWQSYTIRKGDSWYRISRRSGVPIAVLKRVNKRSSNLIKPGQNIMIPGSGSNVSWPDSNEKTRQLAQKRGNYVVARGDTLSAISRQFGVSVSSLMKANGIGNPRNLRPGQKLYIPSYGSAKSAVAKQRAAETKKTIVYRVRAGDSVWVISRRFGVPYTDVLRWNKLSKRSVLKPGDKLTLYVD